MNTKNTTMMKELPADERPYEKCLAYGPQILSDAELLAVIMRSGTRGRTSVELAREVLRLGNEQEGLSSIHHLSMQELMQIDGIGKVKAIQIKAIAELSKRMVRCGLKSQLLFDHPESIAQYYMEALRHEEQEILLCMMLDTKNHLAGESRIFKGTVNASLVSPREVFLEALRQRAVNIILVHNHPSGDPTPSKQDILITDRIRRSGELLGIQLLDHIIIGNHRYVSLRQMNLLPEVSD